MTKKVVRRKVNETGPTSPATREAIARLRGSFKGLGLLEALLEERAKDREREDTKWDKIRRSGKQPKEQTNE